MNRTKSEDAVSPVIGVMLMLVVTIIIAAVVATFAGGIGMDNEPAPTTVLDVTRFTDEVESKNECVVNPDAAGTVELLGYEDIDGNMCLFEVTDWENHVSERPAEGNYIEVHPDAGGGFYILADGETKDSLTFSKYDENWAEHPYGSNQDVIDQWFIQTDTETKLGQKLTLKCSYGDPLDLSKVTISIYSSGSGKLIHEVKGLTGTISPGETKVIPFNIDLKGNAFVDIAIYYGSNKKISEVENLKVIEVVHEV